MRKMHDLSLSMDGMNICCVMLAVLFSSCSGSPVQREAQQAVHSDLAPRYSIVSVIHGDGDYLYHDTNGREFNADEEALAETKRIGRRNPQAEVFIFHQRPRRHFLFFFPLHDGEFFHYRNGELVAHDVYWRDQDQSRFETEADLYRRLCSDNKDKLATVFLYCGHEIPDAVGFGYDESYPNRQLTVQSFADGIKGFTRDSTRFDLIVLSTCFGGTPRTISALASSGRYVVASPENLHLSYFDLHLLERLDLNLDSGGVSAFAGRFARRAFDRLTRDVQTSVSVAVYDVDHTQQFLRSVDKTHDHTLPGMAEERQLSVAMVEHCDCADLPAYAIPEMSAGVDVFFRPARFGRSKYRQTHSGWECWKVTEPQSAALRTAARESE